MSNHQSKFLKESASKVAKKKRYKDTGRFQLSN